MATFKFSPGIPGFDTSKTFFVSLNPKISNVEQLHRAIFWQFWFEGYYGMNWDALYDSFCYLDSIPFRHIVLYHSVVPKLQDEDLISYLRVLTNRIARNSESGVPEFECYFSAADRQRIESLVERLPGVYL